MIIILLGVVVYRVIINATYCDTDGEWNAATCFIVTTVCSSLINAVCILILGKVGLKLSSLSSNIASTKVGLVFLTEELVSID